MFACSRTKERFSWDKISYKPFLKFRYILPDLLMVAKFYPFSIFDIRSNNNGS